ncbi:hypothetical protein [Sphingomonas sp.]|uniref:hypothetical protein n=1 Tax=Sphingomonas sp. TaxID=28214 RepID=UPI002E35552A|nr:hypothetical protein [Sphingomonas sp.]HEX4693149.1 hypothetical protein [Sphingomonas sp.]
MAVTLGVSLVTGGAGVAEACGAGETLAVGAGVVWLAGAVAVARRVGVAEGVLAGVGALVARGVGVDSGTTIGVGVGIGRLNGATTGPDVGAACGVARGDGGRLKLIPGLVCGAAVFDCAAATAGSIATTASHTPAHVIPNEAFIPITSNVFYLNARQPQRGVPIRCFSGAETDAVPTRSPARPPNQFILWVVGGERAGTANNRP